MSGQRKGTLVEEEVIQVIVEQLCVKRCEAFPIARLEEDLGADSLDLVELQMALEDEFGIEIPDEEANKLKTVEDVVNYVKAKK